MAKFIARPEKRANQSFIGVERAPSADGAASFSFRRISTRQKMTPDQPQAANQHTGPSNESRTRAEGATRSSKSPGKARRPWPFWMFMLLAVLGASTCTWRCMDTAPPSVPDKVVLELDLERPLLESVSATPLNLLSGDFEQTTLQQIIDALDRAAEDPRVFGLYARVGGQGFGMARTQELRDAILRFRATGKVTLAFAETFGELAPGQAGYWLASAFENVWLQPSGSVGVMGFASETPFFRGTLEKLDVKPSFAARKEYKTFIHTFTERELTPAHRESATRILETFNDVLVEALQTERKMTRERAEEMLRLGPYGAEDALAAGLVDHLGYRDEALQALRERVGQPFERLFAARYAERAVEAAASSHVFAMVRAEGMVLQGASSVDPFSGSSSMGADDITKALRAALRAPEVSAIILRIDSPGGSWVAADAIRRQVELVSAAGKPVVVSMGNVAASGGYAIAMSADRIVAQPTTLTGSIGVGGGKMALEGLWEKLGVTWGRIETVPDAFMTALSRDFSEREWQKFQAMLDRTYREFVSAAARGRKLSEEELEKVAKGRVWTGKDALEKRLVDALGGVDVATIEAKKILGIPDNETVEIRNFPEEQTFWQLLLASVGQEMPENSDAEAQSIRVQMSPAQWSLSLQRFLLDVLHGHDNILMTPAEVIPLTRF